MEGDGEVFSGAPVDENETTVDLGSEEVWDSETIPRRSERHNLGVPPERYGQSVSFDQRRRIPNERSSMQPATLLTSLTRSPTNPVQTRPA
ncbi:unnamed protein product, partial [Allacma fusca]